MEMPVVSGDDREAIAPRCRGDIAVFNGHASSCSFKEMFLFGPHMSHGHAESVDAAVHGIDQAGEPRLQRLPLFSLFTADPIGELRDDDRTGVTAVLLLFQPGDNTGVSVSFRRLGDYVGVEQPVHSFRRRRYSRRRGGRSSMLTGHSFRILSQFFFPASRRKTIASSSASNLASK